MNEHTNPTNSYPPEQYWWDHLTRKQQLFLLSYPITSLSPLYLNIVLGTEDERIQVWYQYSLYADLHSLQGWPETTIDDLRKI